MKNRRAITAFYVETLLMIVVFIVIIMVLTRILVLSKAQEDQARHLTRSVTIAANVAEGLSLSGDIEENLKEAGVDGSLVEESQDSAVYQGTWKWTGTEPDRYDYKVVVTRTREGRINHDRIQIFYGQKKKPVYTLEADHFSSLKMYRRGAVA